MVDNSVATLVFLVIVMVGGIDHAIVAVIVGRGLCWWLCCILVLLLLSWLLPCFLDKTKKTLSISFSRGLSCVVLLVRAVTTIIGVFLPG